MNIIEILEESIRTKHRKEWYSFLLIEKLLVEKYFEWLDLEINKSTKSLLGKGFLIVEGKKYNIILSYSPFNIYRYDRIFINDTSIEYNNKIHLYGDKSLCLYHPVMDKPILGTIPLFKMIPWITEWIIFYQQWKKYGVWLGNEIKH